MKTVGESRSRYEICCPGLPLAVYREVAAHLQQVQGLIVGLTPSRSQQFDYSQSQIGSLWFQFGTVEANEADEVTVPETVRRQQVDRILSYYSQRYRAWQDVPSSIEGHAKSHA